MWNPLAYFSWLILPLKNLSIPILEMPMVFPVCAFITVLGKWLLAYSAKYRRASVRFDKMLLSNRLVSAFTAVPTSGAVLFCPRMPCAPSCAPGAPAPPLSRPNAPAPSCAAVGRLPSIHRKSGSTELTYSASCGMVTSIEEGFCDGSPWALITGTALSVPGIVSRVVRGLPFLI